GSAYADAISAASWAGGLALFVGAVVVAFILPGKKAPVQEGPVSV
ncbi:MAG: transporter, partial [Rhodococcus erythropolis]|nr:transporter [Rhodococcus erythropolis]